jgi:hypothetical protein
MVPKKVELTLGGLAQWRIYSLNIWFLLGVRDFQFGAQNYQYTIPNSLGGAAFVGLMNNKK